MKKILFSIMILQQLQIQPSTDMGSPIRTAAFCVACILAVIGLLAKDET